MADEAQGVQTVEETTTDSSTENETTQNDVADNPKTENETKTVPYDRLQEVIAERNEIKNQLAEIKSRLPEPKVQETAPANPQDEIVKQQLDKMLKDMGYVNKADLEIKEADRQLSETMKSLESKYDGKSGLPKFDRSKVLEYAQSNLIGNLEIAYKQMNEAAILDNAIKAALGKTKGVKSEVSDGSGSSNVGTSDSDLRTAAMQGDEEAKRTLIKRAIL